MLTMSHISSCVSLSSWIVWIVSCRCVLVNVCLRKTNVSTPNILFFSFHGWLAIPRWFVYGQLKPNSITLSSSRAGSRDGLRPAANRSTTRFELSRHVEIARTCLRQVGNQVCGQLESWSQRPARELVADLLASC